MTARGEDLADLCASAARVRDAGLESAGTARCAAAGCRSPIRARCSSRSRICAATAATTARLSPCRASCAPRAPACILEPDEILDIARRGGRTRLQGSAIHPRRPARGSVAGGARVARRTRLRLDAVLRAGDGDPGAGGNRAAAAPEPRRDELVGDVAAQAGGAVDGHDARDDVAAAVRDERACALRQPGQGPGGSAAHAHRRGPAVDPVHHRSAGRHRRDAGRACRNLARDSQVAQGVRACPGSDRAEFPRQGTHRDGRRRPTPGSTTTWRRWRWRGWCSARACASRRRPTWCPATSAWR